VIGKPNHVEVRGIVEDLERYAVIPDETGVRYFGEPKLGIISQSTTPPRLTARLTELIRQANPRAEIRGLDTICQPTRDRQLAIERLIDQVDTMIVVGGKNSNNTRQLVKLSEEKGKPAYHIQSAGEIDPAWLRGAETVGLTAGTSTLDETIEEVYQQLLRIAETSEREAISGALH
jgi:4-hydroxy-3-methylbut-2-en-1-yl diphosphate reductase